MRAKITIISLVSAFALNANANAPLSQYFPEISHLLQDQIVPGSAQQNPMMAPPSPPPPPPPLPRFSDIPPPPPPLPDLQPQIVQKHPSAKPYGLGKPAPITNISTAPIPRAYQSMNIPAMEDAKKIAPAPTPKVTQAPFILPEEKITPIPEKSQKKSIVAALDIILDPNMVSSVTPNSALFGKIPLKPKSITGQQNVSKFSLDIFTTKQDSTYSSGLKNLALNALNNSDYENALSFYKTIIAEQPNDIDSLIGYAIASEETGNLDEAIKTYHKIISTDNNHETAINNLIALAARYDRSATLRKLTEINARSQYSIPPVIAHIGLIYMDQKNGAKAVEHLMKAASLRPNHSWYQYNLASALEHVGATEQAQIIYQNLLSSAKAGYSTPVNINILERKISSIN